MGSHHAPGLARGVERDRARAPDRARRLVVLLAAGPAGGRRDRDAGRDLRSRGVSRHLAADRLDADRLSVASSMARAEQPTFACLWCGRSWTVRSADDLEGYAKLCPDCLGKAGDNEFLRFRLRSALEARAAASTITTPPTSEPVAPVAPSRPAAASIARSEPAAPSRSFDPTPSDPDMVAYYDARAPEYDDWYLRRGRYEHGPIHDAAWNAELDAAGRWLDGLAIAGRIVELAAGTGWWSPLLASKGELWMYDAAPAPLARARERLLAHRLRAHLHVRDAWADPDDPPADAVVAGF